MSREDLLMKNVAIVKDVVLNTAPLSPNAIIIVVTNPLDVMCYVAQHTSGFPYSRVIGMAGDLDGARLIHFVREHVQGDVRTMKTMVLGTHGDEMVPLARFSAVSGKKLRSLVTPEVLADVVEKTKKGGAQIVSLLKSGSAYYAPAAAAFAMVRSIVRNTNDMHCASVYADGVYGIVDTYCGLPVKLGAQGVTEIIELELNDDELELLKKSSAVIKENIDKVKNAS
jgi:malate dehydrogenase